MGPKDFTHTVAVQTGAEFVQATWMDGHAAFIKEMPARVWLARKSLEPKPKQKKKPAADGACGGPVMKRPAAGDGEGTGQAMVGICKATGQAIKLVSKTSRGLLWVIKHGGSSILHNRQNIEGSKKVMEDIFKKLENGELQPDKEELRKLRDKMSGFTARTCKKPAVAPGVASGHADVAADAAGGAGGAESDQLAALMNCEPPWMRGLWD